MKMSIVGEMAPPESPPNLFDTPENRIDWDSVLGKFGWAPVDNFDVPYIIRSGEKYTAIRIAEMKLLQQFKALCNNEVYTCFNIKQYHITEAEARLLNEINIFHCNGLYGNFPFTVRDNMLKLNDVQLLYDLFTFIKSALDDKVDLDTAPCGFIRMDDQPPVPYVVVKGQKYSPMFYFEGAAEYLEENAIDLEGWGLSYLKFCCKVQGIRQEFYSDDKCQVVKFEEIKKFLPPETKFTFMWPKNIVKTFFSALESQKAKQKSRDVLTISTNGNIPNAAQQQSQAVLNQYMHKEQLSQENYLSVYGNYLNQQMYMNSPTGYPNGSLNQTVDNFGIPQNR